jgi:hypothetical protein
MWMQSPTAIKWRSIRPRKRSNMMMKCLLLPRQTTPTRKRMRMKLQRLRYEQSHLKRSDRPQSHGRRKNQKLVVLRHPGASFSLASKRSGRYSLRSNHRLSLATRTTIQMTKSCRLRAGRGSRDRLSWKVELSDSDMSGWQHLWLSYTNNLIKEDWEHVNYSVE